MARTTLIAALVAFAGGATLVRADTPPEQPTETRWSLSIEGQPTLSGPSADWKSILGFTRYELAGSEAEAFIDISGRSNHPYSFSVTFPGSEVTCQSMKNFTAKTTDLRIAYEDRDGELYGIVSGEVECLDPSSEDAPRRKAAVKGWVRGVR